MTLAYPRYVAISASQWAMCAELASPFSVVVLWTILPDALCCTVEADLDTIGRSPRQQGFGQLARRL